MSGVAGMLLKAILLTIVSINVKIPLKIMAIMNSFSNLICHVEVDPMAIRR
jgi:hypothetical protein